MVSFSEVPLLGNPHSFRRAALMLLALTFTRPGPAGADSVGPKPLGNADIISMTQNQFDEATLQTAIQTHPCHFDTSTSGLVSLKKAGVSENVIRMMMVAGEGRPTRVASAASGAPPAGMPTLPPGLTPEVREQMRRMGYASPGENQNMPKVVVLGKKPYEIPMATAQIANTKGKWIKGAAESTLRYLGQEAMSFSPINPGGFLGFGTPKITHLWLLPGARAATNVEEKAPTLEIQMADLVGLDPETFDPWLAKLVVTKDNYRLIGASRVPEEQMYSPPGEGELEKITEDRVDCTVMKKALGLFQLQPKAPLAPGQYAVILRPRKHHKPAPTGMEMAHTLIYSAWDFQVP